MDHSVLNLMLSFITGLWLCFTFDVKQYLSVSWSFLPCNRIIGWRCMHYILLEQS